MLLNKIEKFIEKDRYVSNERAKETLFARQMVALIAGIGFLIMSVANIKEESELMLVSTLIGAAVMFLSFGISKFLKSDMPLFVSFTLALAGLLPLYVVRGGNEGFAALWLCVVTYLSMYFVNFLFGFALNVYYTIVLFLCFYLRLPFVNYDAYSKTFLLRFPLLFVINFAFATFFIISSRTTQYELLTSQRKFKELSITDLNTGTYNRNAFVDYLAKFDNSVDRLLTVIYIDANGLHELNNTKGHLVGDLFLKSIADECKDAFRDDKVYRMGGDEFLIISLTKDNETADQLMRNVCDNLKKQRYSIAYGIESKTAELNLKEMVDESNRVMLINKSNYYRSSENDRRARR